MNERRHYLLISSATCQTTFDEIARGRWHFVPESVDGSDRLDASADEFDMSIDRLALLAVVRGLEALDQPSRVTLLTPSRYVARGLRFGINAWRETHWQWEHFGSMAPIKNADLWRRVGTAMEFHDLQCRMWRFDAAEATVAETEPSPVPKPHFKNPRGNPRHSAAVEKREPGLARLRNFLTRRDDTAVQRLASQPVALA